MKNLIFFLVLTAAACPAVVGQNGAKYPPAPVLGSQVRTLRSAETGRTYDLYIQAPKPTSPGQKFPVLYAMDGQWDFKLMDSVKGGLIYDKFIPEIIVVGVTYSGENAEYGKLRAMDYTPTKNPAVDGSGDAPKFLAFLKQEVFPLIEREYAGDPARRMISGNSLGGLFVLYAMLTEPDLFTGYIASSPAVTVDNRAIFKAEAKVAQARRSLPARLYISAGEREDLVPPVRDFIAALTAHRYAGLEMRSMIFPGEGHTSNKPLTYNFGLRYVMTGK
jgi:predicted alpha/beta superfamily hydrolase